jgi:hypothetical protein
MGAEALTDVDVSWHGLAGDRRWAFIRNGVEQTGFPWLTLRDRGNLNHYRPSFVDPSRPDQSATVVSGGLKRRDSGGQEGVLTKRHHPRAAGAASLGLRRVRIGGERSPAAASP